MEKILHHLGYAKILQIVIRLLEFCKLLTAEFLSSTVHAITSNTPTLYFCILAKDYGVPSDNEIWPQRPTNYSQIWRILTMTFKLLLSKNVSMRTSNFFEVQIKQLFPAPHIFNHFHFTIQNFTKRWCSWGSVSALRCFRFSERSSCSRRVMRSRVSPMVTRSESHSLTTISGLGHLSKFKSLLVNHESYDLHREDEIYWYIEMYCYCIICKISIHYFNLFYPNDWSPKTKNNAKLGRTWHDKPWSFAQVIEAFLQCVHLTAPWPRIPHSTKASKKLKLKNLNIVSVLVSNFQGQALNSFVTKKRKKTF